MLRKRVRISRRRPVEEPEIIVIPMIDVMMFLLFFFMVASLAMAVQIGLPVNLPKASQSSQHPAQNITITVMKNNQIYLNTRQITLDHLTAGLEALHVSPDNLVILNVDGSVAYSLVVGVENEASKAGITHFTSATSKS